MGIARNWLSGDHAKGLVLAVGGILILSPDSLLVRLITADQYSLLFWRGLMTFCTLSLYLLLTHRGQAWTQVARIGYLGWAVALLFALNTSLFVFSIRHTSVANTLLILSLAPLITALFSSLFLGEHAPPYLGGNVHWVGLHRIYLCGEGSDGFGRRYCGGRTGDDHGGNTHDYAASALQ